MTRRILGHGVSIALGIAIILDLGLLIDFALEARRLHVAVSHYDSLGGAYAALPPTWFRTDGRAIGLVAGRTALAVRYTGSNCPASLTDGEWQPLARALQERGVQISVLLPRTDLGFSESDLVPRGASQVAYVAAEWIKRYPVTLTPTLLIFDRDSRLIWHKEGALTRADARAAIRAVEGAKGPQ
jgi:hypothetical protein